MVPRLFVYAGFVFEMLETLDTNDKILQLITNNPKLNAVIIEQSIDMGEKAINIKKTMKELMVVGELLDIADLGSDGFNVNVSVKVRYLLIVISSYLFRINLALQFSDLKLCGNCRSGFSTTPCSV